MTLLSPTIAINRLVVFRDTEIAFDGTFHNGVNIVRGHNSSGKTTILDFIAYTLGAEYIPWKYEALFCSHSVAEISLNRRRITVRRDVNEKPMNPMYIYWGPIEEALAAPFSKWESYGFRRSSSKLSFTQALLLALELPEAQGDGASNLTMHQFLRVMYADQPSLHSPIFRVDAFDSALTRETVGGYLSGIFDDRLYVAQLEKREVDKELDRLNSELKSIFTVLGRSGQNANVEFLGQEIRNLEARRETLQAELNALKTNRIVPNEETASKADSKIRLELDKAKSELAEAQSNLARWELEIEDSNRFIEEIQLRLNGLEESSTTRDYFSSLSFAFCPSCLSEIKVSTEHKEQCGLCKTPFSESVADAQLLRMRNELRIQLGESQAIVRQRIKEVGELRTKLPMLKRHLKSLEDRFREASSTWSTDLESALEAQSRAIGALDQEIRGLYGSQQLAQAILELQERRNTLVVRVGELETRIESLIFTQEERKQQVAREVASTLGRLLSNDLHRTDAFQRATDIQFSFTDNKVLVENESQFSESSTVVLRHLFHLALLSASTRLPVMRFPRFLILDGIEDGGMELERSHRLQEIIVNECATFNCDYQLIFATSQIAPQLDVEGYVVARSFTEDARSLDFL